MEKEFSAKKLRSVFLVSFLLSTGLALTNYVDSSFLGTKIDVKNIGLIFSAGSITSIVLLSLAPRIIKNIGVRGLFYFAALLYLTSVLGMIYITTPIIFVLCFVFYVASAYGLYFAIDMFIERMSANKNAGVSRGTYLTIYNTAFLIGPLIAGTILKNYSYKLLYLIAGVFMITMFLLFIKNLEKTKFLPPRQSSFKAIFRALPKNKNLLNVYFVSLMLTFFFSWMGIFAPIYLKSVMGFDWQQIGTMFALMHIPYILLQLPFGSLADRYNCERSLMLIGLVIIALSTATLGFFYWSRFLDMDTCTHGYENWCELGSSGG